MNAQTPTSKAAALPALRWHERLSFKLAAIMLVLLILALVGAVVAGKLLVRNELADETFRYEQQVGLRLTLQIEQYASQAEATAKALAALTLSASPEQLRSLAPAILAHSPMVPGAAGVWLEPNGLRPGVERASLLWMRGADGKYTLREDYNNPRVVPYWREKWYTPARFLRQDRCAWNLRSRDPLAKAATLVCSLPLRQGERFLGVITVALPFAQLTEEFARQTQEDRGYAVLLDADNQLLAVSPALAARLQGGDTTNLAGLAQRFGAYNPLALSLHERGKILLEAFAATPMIADADNLKAATREMSQEEARTALLSLWMGDRPKALWPAEPAVVLLEQDPVLKGRAYVHVFELGYPGWRLLRITSATEGYAGADMLFLRALLVLAAAMAGLLLLVYIGIRLLLLRPLGRMVAQMSETAGTQDTLGTMAQDKSVNELGLFAHWHNERVRQVRDLMDRNMGLSSQLVTETSERRNAQESATRFQERHALSMQALSEAVISTDEAGRIEDMNPAAERLSGIALRTARSRPFGEVFVARVAGNAAATPDLAKLAMERGSRVDYDEGLALAGKAGADRLVAASAIPIRNRSNRITGAAVVLRERTAAVVATAVRETPAAAAQAIPANDPQRDPLTQRPLRPLCERRLRELIDAAKLAPRSHALVWLDIDQFARINDAAGPAAGDQVLVRLSELLGNLTGQAGEIFRLGADRFGIVLANSSTDRARTFAEALRRTVASTRFTVDGRQFNLSVSIGIVEFDGQADTAIDVMRRAEEACGAAKRGGRNSIKVYDDSMSRHRPPADDSVWLRRLRNGLEHGLLHMTTQLLQPQAGGGKALDLQLALEDEEGFWTAAPGFMPAAERHGMAGELDRWTLRRILTQLAQQPGTLGDLSFLCIPLSAVSPVDPRFVDSLLGLLGQPGSIAASKLCFVIEQAFVMQHPQTAAAFATTLRTMGCLLAIDGFGPGSSGEMGVLRRLSADFLRIDAGGFPALTTDAVEQSLADSVVKLAHTLGSRLIVANIEDPRVAESWKRLGADYLQGNAIARASPVVIQVA